jgi:hypothetical protein
MILFLTYPSITPTTYNKYSEIWTFLLRSVHLHHEILDYSYYAHPRAPPVIDLAPTSYDSRDSAIYSVMVDHITLYSGDPAGNHTVYVIETYSAFGVRVSSSFSYHAVSWDFPESTC